MAYTVSPGSYTSNESEVDLYEIDTSIYPSEEQSKSFCRQSWSLHSSLSGTTFHSGYSPGDGSFRYSSSPN